MHGWIDAPMHGWMGGRRDECHQLTDQPQSTNPIQSQPNPATSESQRLHLLAVTADGRRVFFSTNPNRCGAVVPLVAPLLQHTL
jgi:hypothetical protein